MTGVLAAPEHVRRLRVELLNNRHRQPRWRAIGAGNKHAMRNRNNWDDVYTLIATVLPLVAVIFYALPCIIRKRTFGWYGAEPRTGDEAVTAGIGIIGLALLVHAWHLPLYRRFPKLRWFLLLIGAMIFGGGLLWPLWRAL